MSKMDITALSTGCERGERTFNAEKKPFPLHFYTSASKKGNPLRLCASASLRFCVQKNLCASAPLRSKENPLRLCVQKTLRLCVKYISQET